MTLIRSYVNKIAAGITSDGILPWDVFDTRGYVGKSSRAGY